MLRAAGIFLLVREFLLGFVIYLVCFPWVWVVGRQQLASGPMLEKVEIERLLASDVLVPGNGNAWTPMSGGPMHLPMRHISPCKWHQLVILSRSLFLGGVTVPA